MKKILILFSFFFTSHIFSQVLPTIGNQKNMIYFWHDKNGNRIKKEIHTIDCQVIEFPPNEPEPEPGPGRSLPDTIHLVNTDDFGINLYPNPTQGVVNITINTKYSLEGASIYVFDLKGTTVYSKNHIKNKTAESISLEDLPDGIYLIKLKLNNLQEIVWKVEKN